MAYSIIGADGQQYGPAEIDDLVNWARQGRVIASTEVIDHGNSRRYLACDLPELHALFHAAANSSSTVPGNPPGYAGHMPPAPPPAPPYMPQFAPPPPQNMPYPPPMPYAPMQMPVQVLYPVTLTPPKSRMAAGLLAIFLGPFGIHRFYLGYSGLGIAMLMLTFFTCGFGAIATALWGIIEGIIILCGGMHDSQGRPLQW